MESPTDLYRQTKVAQRQAERGGFVNTATALAAIAEMLIREAGVYDEVIREFEPRTAPPSADALPIFRHARC